LKQTPVILTIALKAKPGREKALIAAASSLIIHSRAERGCLSYHMNQSSEDPTSFLIYMRWKDELAYQKHLASPLIKEFHTHWAEEMLTELYQLTRWDALE